MRIALIGVAFLVAAAAATFTMPQRAALEVSALLLIVFLGLLVRGMASVRSSLVERTIWRSDDAHEKRVGLSFDDGPHPSWTPRILDVLRDRGVKATFFLIGENVRRHPDAARRIVEEGHEVACHADTHAPMTTFFRPARMGRELRDCLDAIRAAAGVTPRLYRPPFGIRSPAHAGVAARNDLLVVGMARRGLDRDAAPAAVAARTVGLARGGEILALHDGTEPGHRDRPTCSAADALPAILDGLAAAGLTPVPVSTLLAERPYRESPERPWTGRSRGGRLGNAFFAWTVGRLGTGPASFCLVFVAAWFVVVHGEGRRASIELRRRLHGRANAFVETAWAYRHFFVFGRSLLARLAYVQGAAAMPEPDYVGFERVKDVVEEPGGLLIVSAHLGDWASAGRCFRRQGRTLWIVALQGTGLGPHQLQRDAADAPFRLIDVAASPIIVATQIAAALGKGDAVALLGDRVLSGEGVAAPFLGGDAVFPKGIWTVAMLTGAPAISVFAVPGAGGRTTVYVDGPIRVPRVQAEGREAVLRAAATEYARHLEAVVRRHPFQWANFYPFWKRP